MIKRFGFHSNSRGADEMKYLPISIDFQAKKHGFAISCLVLTLSKDFQIIKTFRNNIIDYTILLVIYLTESIFKQYFIGTATSIV